MLSSYIDSLPPPPRRIAATEAGAWHIARAGLAVAAVTAGIVWSWQEHSQAGAVVCAVVGLVIAVSLAMSYRREQLLARYGVGTVATIAGLRRVGRGQYLVSYLFRAGDQAYRSRSIVAFGEYVPAMGERIAILYDPAAPLQRNAALVGLTMVAPE